MLNRYRRQLSNILNKIGNILVNAGFKAWYVTLLGLILTILAGSVILIFHQEIAVITSGILYILAGFMDSLDGTVARIRKEVSAWGGFIDAYLDRVEEAAYLIMLIPSQINPDPVYIAIFLSLSFLTSYSRSKAHEVGIKLAGVGLMERAERIIILGIGVMITSLIHINVILIILIFLTGYTVCERVYRIYRATH